MDAMRTASSAPIGANDHHGRALFELLSACLGRVHQRAGDAHAHVLKAHGVATPARQVLEKPAHAGPRWNVYARLAVLAVERAILCVREDEGSAKTQR